MPGKSGLGNANAGLRERVLWLDAEMRAGRYPSCERLRRRFGVSLRTATAALEYMRRDLGLNIGYSRRHEGYAYHGEPPPPLLQDGRIVLSAGELRALDLAIALGHRYLDISTVGDLITIQDRLLAAAGDESQLERVTPWPQVVFTGPRPLDAPGLDPLHAAITKRQVVEICYSAPGRSENVIREVEPHFLVSAGGDWLLVAWDRFRRAPRTFALRRINEIERTGERFEPRPELVAAEFVRHQFLTEGGKPAYPLVLRVSPATAMVAQEREWHPSQKWRTLPDGGGELRLAVCGESDVLRWILGFGPDVEVVEPGWLRRLVEEAAAATAARYRSA